MRTMGVRTLRTLIRPPRAPRRMGTARRSMSVLVRTIRGVRVRVKAGAPKSIMVRKGRVRQVRRACVRRVGLFKWVDSASREG